MEEGDLYRALVRFYTPSKDSYAISTVDPDGKKALNEKIEDLAYSALHGLMSSVDGGMYPVWLRDPPRRILQPDGEDERVKWGPYQLEDRYIGEFRVALGDALGDNKNVTVNRVGRDIHGFQYYIVKEPFQEVPGVGGQRIPELDNKRAKEALQILDKADVNDNDFALFHRSDNY